MRNLGVIVLAAGGASRFGSPKQNAVIGGRSLLEIVCETVLELDTRERLLVAGAIPVEYPGFQTVANDDWQEGLSSSIRAGVFALGPEVGRCLILLVDQPFVTADHLRKLVSAEARIAASEYPDGRLGVPAAFDRYWFPKLRLLSGDTGAKALIEQEAARVARVPFNEGSDIDTPDDLVRLRSLRPTEGFDSGTP